MNLLKKRKRKFQKQAGFKVAAYDWFNGFVNPNKSLEIRRPESTSIGRPNCFNRSNVKEIHDNIEDVYKRYQFLPENTWNIDETGVTRVHKPTRVIPQKGEKQVGQATSSQRGILITVCNGVNAIGNHIPNFMIFLRVNVKDYMYHGAHPGTLEIGNPKLIPLGPEYTLRWTLSISIFVCLDVSFIFPCCPHPS